MATKRKADSADHPKEGGASGTKPKSAIKPTLKPAEGSKIGKKPNAAGQKAGKAAVASLPPAQPSSKPAKVSQPKSRAKPDQKFAAAASPKPKPAPKLKPKSAATKVAEDIGTQSPVNPTAQKPDKPETPYQAAVAPLAAFASQMWQANPLSKLLPLDMAAIVEAVSTVSAQALEDPARANDEARELTLKLWQNASDTWTAAIARWSGQTSPVTDRDKAPGGEVDRRFDAPEWEQNPFFHMMKQTYGLLSEQLLKQAERADLEGSDKQRLAFHLRQLIDASSPTVFLPTNPAALRKAMETGGTSVANGMRQLLADLDSGRLNMTDTEAFAPGRNLALTLGKVVFRNKLIELIQYAPKGEKAHEVPLLILPPWINKYYILDLQPKNSLVAYLVDQGFTVFMVSWKNPDASLEETSLDDYMLDGPIAASDAVRRITGTKQINAMGYCIGGTLLMMTLAALAAKGDDRFSSATLMVSMQDFTEVGDTAVFMDEPHIEFIEKQMLERGYLDSRHMSDMFNMLRPNDLIWGAVVNNYLMGEKPPAFDLLYWNADGTRMARAAHSFYLRNTYIENNLIKPGAITLLGEKLDLRKITQDIYAVGAEKDHIVPWRAAWQVTRLTGGDVRYVLAASGHIAGMINPPAKAKGGHLTNDSTSRPATPDDWLAGAVAKQGSWWADWAQWLAAHSGEKVAVPPMGSKADKPLCDAPGTYVMER